MFSLLPVVIQGLLSWISLAPLSASAKIVWLTAVISTANEMGSLVVTVASAVILDVQKQEADVIGGLVRSSSSTEKHAKGEAEHLWRVMTG